MQKSNMAVAVAVGLGLGFGASAFAQYQGPGSQLSQAQSKGTITTVSEVRKRGRDDQMVTLTGFVTKKVGREKYLFRDSTGEIRIEIDDDVMPNEQFDEKTKVEVTGEVEKDFLHSIEIDAKAIRILR